MPLTWIAVLCVARRSPYLALENVELFSQERDALTFKGGMPVVAHPPCAQWSRMRGLSRRSLVEAWLGPFCYEQVRLNGGVLEHPAHSQLWSYLGIKPLVVSARWFGFPAEKPTGLWFNRCEPGPIPYSLDASSAVVATSKRGVRQLLPVLAAGQRSLTAPAMAAWLVAAARSVDSTHT